VSIQFFRVESVDGKDHDKQVQTMLNDGFTVVSNHVTCTYVGEESELEMVYTTFVQRGSTEGSVNKASVIELQEKRIRRLERLVKQLQNMLEGYTDDEVAPWHWVENQLDMLKVVGSAKASQVIPLASITVRDVVEEALKEDAAQEGAIK